MTFRDRFDAARAKRLGLDAAKRVQLRAAAFGNAQVLIGAAVAGKLRTARLPLTNCRRAFLVPVLHESPCQ